MYAVFGAEISYYNETTGTWNPVVTTAGTYFRGSVKEEGQMQQPEMNGKDSDKHPPKTKPKPKPRPRK